ncbi:tyrosine-type recombinase/integrase [Brevibacillus borstelensis]|uniref:tyrosine-type recombinase/integrase n=1 Tax=Brevibacillus borstelensis TaxID=45462 RepID=UPI000469F5ED|nr:tyrosine-type recombinase/integrase [Brevibacillus borstelensis]MCM3591144.1 site-specific integrase [Brevibacillus borstelensis]NOU56128.1 tyrosine-type recombinase/integrase [Brevibacillus borstelensis]
MDFATYLKEQEVRDKTIKSYLATVQEYRQWQAGLPDQEDEISQLLLLEFKSYLKTVRKNHPKTINKKLAGIRKWLEYLQATGQFKGVIQIKDEALSEFERLREPKYLDKDEVREIRKAIEKEPNDFLRDRDRCMIYLMLYLGLRQEEAISLQISDIIRTAGKQKVIIREGKGGFYAELPLESQELRKALDQWMEQRSQSRFADSPYLFVSRRTPRAGKRAVVKMIDRVRKTSGVEFTSHQLRHTFGKRIIDETGNIKKAQELLRHRHTSSTEIYTLHRREELVGVLRKLDDVI